LTAEKCYRKCFLDERWLDRTLNFIRARVAIAPRFG
jgi:hypothetical protein